MRNEVLMCKVAGDVQVTPGRLRLWNVQGLSYCSPWVPGFTSKPGLYKISYPLPLFSSNPTIPFPLISLAKAKGGYMRNIPSKHEVLRNIPLSALKLWAKEEKRKTARIKRRLKKSQKEKTEEIKVISLPSDDSWGVEFIL